jgi:hypothetical protein
MVNIDSHSGRIGPFWWINSCCSATKLIGLYGLTSNPSKHLVWREGGCGFDFPNDARFFVRLPRFHILRALN